MDRRAAIKYMACSPLLAGGLLTGRKSVADNAPLVQLRLATFAADVTPPIGSPLCGGWIPPAQAVDDPLRALGIVLLGHGPPIVLCALDLVETNNSAYDTWREALATAAGTDSSRVAVQCVHPHNAPWVNLEANQLAQAVNPRLQVMDTHWFHEAVQRTAAALKASLGRTQPITHVGVGQACVEKVASTRRIFGADGRVARGRYSASTDREDQTAPEGKIDPYLKTLSFWEGQRPVAALHYYATHPMSYYGDGRITSDFCGLARDQRQREQPEVFQIYFTGCAGDIACGKYNDGSPGMRQVLCDRVHAGMTSAWQATKVQPISEAKWSVEKLRFPPRIEEEFSAETLRRVLADSSKDRLYRLIAAIKLSWLARIDKPVEVSCLRLGGASVLHLPGEPFVHYQLFAQQQRADGFVCVAGYGDGGMGYLPRQESYRQGGYEPTMSFVAPESEGILTAAIKELLS